VIRLEGIDQLTVALKKALTKHKEADVRKTMRRGAKLIVDEAKRLAPVDSGLLRDSIMILPKWSGDPMGVYVGPKVKRKRPSKGSVQKEQPYYAAMVEYGTSAHKLGYKGKYVSDKNGAQHPGMKGKPYMRPAYDTTAQQALNAVIQDVEKMVMQ
jgi:HK97 gp10 family phage protein